MSEKAKNFFKTVTKSGGLFHSKSLSLKATKDGSSGPCVYVVVSKKVTPSAVSRNRLKRRVRGLFSEAGSQSIQAIFYAKKGAGSLSSKELREEVMCLINNVKQEKLSK